MGKKIVCFSLYEYERIISDSRDVRSVCSAIVLAMAQVSKNKLNNHEFCAVLQWAVNKINTF